MLLFARALVMKTICVTLHVTYRVQCTDCVPFYLAVVGSRGCVAACVHPAAAAVDPSVDTLISPFPLPPCAFRLRIGSRLSGPGTVNEVLTNEFAVDCNTLLL